MTPLAVARVRVRTAHPPPEAQSSRTLTQATENMKRD
jgi:hypothetical protein